MMGEFFSTQIFSGSLLISIPIALIAGLISFASPCILPLLPGYVGYLSTLTATGEADAGARVGTRNVRAVASGLMLFVAGFTTVLVVITIAAIYTLTTLTGHLALITRLAGVVVIILGFAFLGVLPGFNRQYQPLQALRTRQVGGYLLGVAFALGWSPCIGPTFAAVLSLAFSEANMARGLALLVCYCIGLGLPFIAVGIMVARRAAVPSFLRRHRLAINRIGGGLLIILGMLLATGLWQRFSSWLVTIAPGGVI